MITSLPTICLMSCHHLCWKAPMARWCEYINTHFQGEKKPDQIRNKRLLLACVLGAHFSAKQKWKRTTCRVADSLTHNLYLLQFTQAHIYCSFTKLLVQMHVPQAERKNKICTCINTLARSLGAGWTHSGAGTRCDWSNIIFEDLLNGGCGLWVSQSLPFQLWDCWRYFSIIKSVKHHLL